MSKGIWTKHFSPEGKAYYFNAAENRSVWQPPANANTHEATNLAIPSKEEFRMSHVAQANEINHGTFAISNAPPADSGTNILPQSNALPATNNSALQQQATDLLTIQERMAQAAANKQKELLSKRAKTDDSTSSLSEYQRQVSELKAREGDREEGSKWLVR